MALLNITGVEKSFGDRRVLRHADLIVGEGERVGLVGVNGSGKSTLMRICAGVHEPDFGTVEIQGRLGLLEQEPKLPGPTVGDAADDGLAWHRELLSSYEAALEREDFDDAGHIQAQLDQRGWAQEHRVDALLERLDCPPRSALVSELSGGEKRRVALVRALLDEPDVLLLDEPTNHLDVETIGWLQQHLERFRGAVLMVTHDRYLLEALATRIVEVEDGETISYPGSYADYLITRAERRASLEKAEDSRLAYIRREAEWASRSPAARSTKQKARLQRLDALTAKRPLKREETFELDLSTGARSGTTLLEAHNVDKAFDGRVLMRDLHLSLQRGQRLGILGPNGCGKSTLLRMIVGEETLDAGDIVLGGRVRIAWLDQHRTGLKEGDTVWEAAADGNKWVTVGDSQVHVAGFLGRFLFTRPQLDQKVQVLSGGERARLLLAKLLLKGCNLLLLDEPTNDLDLLTLRVLEEALLAFDGSALIVTHDRAFLDRVCTGVLHFEGDGEVVPYSSRVQVDAAMARKAKAAARKAPEAKPQTSAHVSRKAAARAAEPKKKLSFKEQREYEELPAAIDALETEHGELEAVLADPATYTERAGEVTALTARYEALPAETEVLYARWTVLDERA